MTIHIEDVRSQSWRQPTSRHLHTSARRELDALVTTFETNRVVAVADRGAPAAAAYDLGIRAAVHESLTKLDRGTYGTCDHCADAIDQDRIRLVPFARRCLPCQQLEEDNWNQSERTVANVIHRLVGEPQGRAKLLAENAEPHRNPPSGHNQESPDADPD